MTQRIWLIGGTQESATLARAFSQANLSCVVSVTTESARSLYPTSSSIEVCVDRFTPDRLIAFLQSQNISVVLDASHPFAVEISQSAIAACSQLKIPYLRFERHTTSVSLRSVSKPTAFKSAANFEQLLATDWLVHQRVLFTIGYRHLSLFQPLHDRATLFARILPSPVALEAALQAGFTSDRIIAIRPPIRYELERSLWQQWQISTVVTKASGAPGGEEIKRQVATELGVQLIVIERPTIEYPQVTNRIEEAIAFCCRFVC